MCGIILKEIKEDLKDFGAICVYRLEDSILSRCFFPIKLYILIYVKVPGHFFLCMLINWFKDVYDSSKT